MPAKITLSHFGEIFDALRTERGDKLRDIARRYGHHEITIGDARRFPLKNTPQRRLLESLADYTGMTSAEIVAAMQDSPEPSAETSYPLITHIGIQYRPALLIGDGGCDRCEYRDLCRHYVIDLDGFALCEDLLPVDMIAEKAVATFTRNYQEDRRVRNRICAVA